MVSNVFTHSITTESFKYLAHVMLYGIYLETVMVEKPVCNFSNIDDPLSYS